MLALARFTPQNLGVDLKNTRRDAVSDTPPLNLGRGVYAPLKRGGGNGLAGELALLSREKQRKKGVWQEVRVFKACQVERQSLAGFGLGVVCKMWTAKARRWNVRGLIS